MIKTYTLIIQVKMIDFSIIIPHYNSSLKCKRLLDSIPNRKDLEVIIVDDKSKEEEFNQLKKIIEEDNKKIKFYSNNGEKGAGAARNKGIKNSIGRFLIFADADDFFLGTFNDILGKYKNNKKDIIYFCMTSIYEDTKKLAERHIAYNKLIINYLRKNKNSKKDLKFRYYSPCGKIYNREYIIKNKFLFDEVLASNDVYFSLISAYDANIFASEECFYCITRGKGSLTVNLSEEVFNSRFRVELKVDNFFKEKGQKKYRKYLFGYVLKSFRYNNKKPIKILIEIFENNSLLFTSEIIKKIFKGAWVRNVYIKIKNKKYEIK